MAKTMLAPKGGISHILFSSPKRELRYARRDMQRNPPRPAIKLFFIKNSIQNLAILC
jgi:hypothetical protein